MADDDDAEFANMLMAESSSSSSPPCSSSSSSSSSSSFSSSSSSSPAISPSLSCSSPSGSSSSAASTSFMSSLQSESNSTPEHNKEWSARDVMWEELVSKSRKHSSQLFSKLAELGKLSTKVSKLLTANSKLSSASLQRSDLFMSSNQSASTGNGQNGQYSKNDESKDGTQDDELAALFRQFAQLETEVEDILHSFAFVHESMSEFIQKEKEEGRTGSVDKKSFIFHRSRQVYYDGVADCKRLKESTKANIRRMQMYTGVEVEAGDSSSHQGRTAQLLKEKDGIMNSIRAVDDLVAQNITARENMERQRNVLGAVGKTIAALGALFPQVNNVIGKIKKHKNRDMIILSLVIAICMTFTVIFWLNKP